MRLAPSLARWAGHLALLTIVLVAPGTVRAQDEGPLRLSVRSSDGGVDAALVGVLTEGGTRSSLDAGLPVRLLVVVDLWRDGFFDSQEARFEWRATVRYDPLGQSYRVETAAGVALQAGSLEGVARFLESVPSVSIRPTRPGRFYYLGRMEIETLSPSDLEELGRWLQGDLGPAIDGSDAKVGSALGRGIRRLLVNLLGLPIRRYETRTPAFEVD